MLAGLLAGAALPAFADAPETSPRPMPRPVFGKPKGAEDLIAAAKLGGVVGYVVADAATGRVLEAANADVAMAPASVTKAVTTLFALDHLGPEHVFTTRVMRVGTLTKATLEGDLVLAGGGDPTFDTDKMGDLVAALAATGLRKVTGRFLAFAGALPERDEITYTQPDFVGYNPAISGLMLNFDRVNFVWKAANGGWITQMNAEGERYVPKVSMATIEVAQREVPKFTYRRGDGQDHWTVAASALGKEGSRWLPVRQPGVYVAEVFRTLCAAQGIDLPPAEFVPALPEGAVQIVAHDSDALPGLLKKMLKYSTNVTAEAVGLTASGAGSLPGSGAVMTDWVQRQLGVSARFGDHSGLGPASRITPAAMAQVMQNAGLARNGAMLRGLLREQGLPDATGKEQKDAALRVRAKSGTMNFVSNLAGYVDAPGRDGLVFAIFAADLPRNEAVPLVEREDPEGQSAWVKRAHRLQKQFLNRWAKAYL
ncbi:MAG: D-alanyl-D-alanine carboxypeptidase/D-alanyl-D-alanine-endopeptidase [Rhodobacteraceae bacterium]|nr:D-alanyl-D-alanine carboxypeptidase/D-alanyl-D-alanine-endopeptidase [Paracoccaceae bacterium]